MNKIWNKILRGQENWNPHCKSEKKRKKTKRKKSNEPMKDHETTTGKSTRIGGHQDNRNPVQM